MKKIILYLLFIGLLITSCAKSNLDPGIGWNYEVKIYNPKNGSNVFSDNLGIQVNAGPSVGKVKFYVDDIYQGIENYPFTYILSTTGWANGAHSIRVESICIRLDGGGCDGKVMDSDSITVYK